MLIILLFPSILIRFYLDMFLNLDIELQVELCAFASILDKY